MQKVASWLKKGATKEEILQAFHDHHVYFYQDQDKSNYLDDIMSRIQTGIHTLPHVPAETEH